jgi:hypothetical protein
MVMPPDEVRGNPQIKDEEHMEILNSSRHTYTRMVEKRGYQLTQQPVLLQRVNIKYFFPSKACRIKWHYIYPHTYFLR